MNTNFKIDFRAMSRIACIMLASLLIIAGLPLFQPSKVQAAQFSQRSIQLSDSGASGSTSVPTGVGSGTGVTYRVSFTAVSAPSGAGSLVIDFCANDPIINDTCVAPTGMNAATAILNNAQITGNVYGTNGWSISAATASHLELSNSNSSQNIVAGNQVFELSSLTNPSTTGSYYARMYTYQNNTHGAYTGPTSTANSQSVASGGIVDYGGIALSTANTIKITARVQEALQFCVTKAAPTLWTNTHGCDDSVVSSAANYPDMTLGHAAGSGTPVLDNGTVDTATVYSQLSTNASNGAVINMRNSNTTCGGLSADSGSTCSIPAVTGNTSSPYTAGPITAGTAAFGVYVSDGVPDSGGVGATGTLPATAAYHDPAHNTFPGNIWYGMDNSTPVGAGAVPKTQTGNVKSLYGSTVAYSSAPMSRVDTTYIFGATAALTTPAGIYTANLSLVATGTF